jgi:hypothetical protein
MQEKSSTVELLVEDKKFVWKRVIGFGKVIHITIMTDNQSKTLCGHNVTNYKLIDKPHTTKCRLCLNIEKQYRDSLIFKERFNVDYNYR